MARVMVTPVELVRKSTGNGKTIMSDDEEFNRAVSAAREFSPYPGEFLEHEFETYDLLRKHIPIARSEALPESPASAPRGGWVVTRYDDSLDVLRNPADFSSEARGYPIRPWIPQAIDPICIRATAES